MVSRVIIKTNDRVMECYVLINSWCSFQAFAVCMMKIGPNFPKRGFISLIFLILYYWPKRFPLVLLDSIFKWYGASFNHRSLVTVIVQRKTFCWFVKTFYCSLIAFYCTKGLNWSSWICRMVNFTRNVLVYVKFISLFAYIYCTVWLKASTIAKFWLITV